MTIKIITLTFASLIFLLVVELIREEKLTFKYAASWLIVSSLAIFFALFDKILFRIAELIGFELPSNFIFFSLLTVLVFLSLLITLFLCQQSNRNDRIAQKIGILENEIEKLKEKNK